jgi:hypothetical protein
MNEKKNYSIKYTIHGIYGDVEFTRNFIDKTISEIKKIKPSLLSTDTSYRNFVKFEIDVDEYDNTSDKRYTLTEDSIEGLPEGVTMDMYFNMATLRDIKSLKTQSTNVNYDFKIDTDNLSDLVISKIQKTLQSKGMR